jgi:transcription antitermination factor NusG
MLEIHKNSPAAIFADTRVAWYAIRVKPQFEKIVALRLRGKGYEEFLPMRALRRERSGRIEFFARPLFPGYIFCRFDENKRLPILITPGVLYIVTLGGRLARIDDDEIASLQSVVGSNLDIEECPYSPGDKVLITSGALTGVQGAVSRTKQNCRVIVSVSMLKRSVAVEVDEASLASMKLN